MTRLYAGSAAALVCALLAGTAYFILVGPQGKDAFSSCRSSTIAGGADQIGGAFTLVDQTGATLTDAQVFTKPSLLYFGYTFCPDVCPLDNARNSEAVDVLEEQGFDVTPVFISVDPKRDTPPILKDYAASMHPRMIALTGTEAQVRTAASAFRAFYQAQPEEGGYYLVDHSTFTYLVLPETGFVEFFRRELPADQLAAQVSCFLGVG